MDIKWKNCKFIIIYILLFCGFVLLFWGIFSKESLQLYNVMGQSLFLKRDVLSELNEKKRIYDIIIAISSGVVFLAMGFGVYFSYLRKQKISLVKYLILMVAALFACGIYIMKGMVIPIWYDNDAMKILVKISVILSSFSLVIIYGIFGTVSRCSCLIRMKIQSKAEALSEEKKQGLEKLKTDLIANISHDLKTPLTTVISYTELMSDETMSKEAEEYLEVVLNNAYRMKKIVEDVVYLSKATSNNLNFEKSEIGLKKLLLQTIDASKESKDVSDDVFQIEINGEEAIVYADGSKWYRVLQNLIENALKYRTKETKIRIQYFCENTTVRYVIENEYSYEMTQSSEELMERFVRGDRSRNSTGSGLGLAIAKELTELQHGTLEIKCEKGIFIASIIINIESVKFSL